MKEVNKIMSETYYNLEDSLGDTPPAPEKRDDFTDTLEDMVLGHEEIPEGMTKEQIIQVLKQHKEFEAERIKAEADAKQKAEMSEAMRTQLRILKGGMYPEQKIDITDSEEVIKAKTEHNKAVADFRALKSQQDQERLNRTNMNFPKVEKPKKDLKEMSFDERQSYFKALGLVKDYKPPK